MSTLKNSIMVNDRHGYYEIPGSSTAEDWNEVQDGSDLVEKIDDLVGWGGYTAVYLVKACDGAELTYFVAEDED